MEDNIILEKVLVRTIVDMLLFFENARDEEVDPDKAIEVLEQVSYTLQSLEKDEMIRFKKLVNNVSEQYEEADKIFVKNICDSFGLSN